MELGKYYSVNIEPVRRQKDDLCRLPEYSEKVLHSSSLANMAVELQHSQPTGAANYGGYPVFCRTIFTTLSV